MLFAAILAGGSGTRMKFSDLPKQFLMLGDKPVIIHTVEKFLLVDEFVKVYVGINPEWHGYFEDLVDKYLSSAKERIQIIDGGKDRTSTLTNVLTDIREKAKEAGVSTEEVYVVTHDAVRPFVDLRIIQDNINKLQECTMVDTVIPAVDTIIVSSDHETIESIPVRNTMYQGQTPQSFQLAAFDRIFAQLTEAEKAVLTDACKVFTLKGEPVHLVEGSAANIKITTVVDLKLAHALIGETYVK